MAPVTPHVPPSHPAAGPLRRWMVAAMVLATCVAAGAEEPATARLDQAQTVVREATRKVLTAVTRERDAMRADPTRAWRLVDSIISPLVDQERIGRAVLGKHWRLASAGQRQRFIAEFRNLVLRTYASALTEYAGLQVEFLSPRAGRTDREVTVRTRLPLNGGGTALGVDYRMEYRDQRWQVFDVRVDGVSLVTTYRHSFAGVVRRDGIDGLIAKLVAKNRGASDGGA